MKRHPATASALSRRIILCFSEWGRGRSPPGLGPGAGASMERRLHLLRSCSMSGDILWSLFSFVMSVNICETEMAAASAVAHFQEFLFATMEASRHVVALQAGYFADLLIAFFIKPHQDYSLVQGRKLVYQSVHLS